MASGKNSAQGRDPPLFLHALKPLDGARRADGGEAGNIDMALQKVATAHGTGTQIPILPHVGAGQRFGQGRVVHELGLPQSRPELRQQHVAAPRPPDMRIHHTLHEGGDQSGRPRHAVQNGSRLYNRNAREPLFIQSRMMNSSRSTGIRLSLWRFGKWRAELAASLRGQFLEIGCGAGPTFRHYYSSCEVIALEQDAQLCREALIAAGKCQADVQVR